MQPRNHCQFYTTLAHNLEKAAEAKKAKRKEIVYSILIVIGFILLLGLAGGATYPY
jgi:flagellar basal body-associated protein FliL